MSSQRGDKEQPMCTGMCGARGAEGGLGGWMECSSGSRGWGHPKGLFLLWLLPAHWRPLGLDLGCPMGPEGAAQQSVHAQEAGKRAPGEVLARMEAKYAEVPDGVACSKWAGEGRDRDIVPGSVAALFYTQREHWALQVWTLGSPGPSLPLALCGVEFMTQCPPL